MHIRGASRINSNPGGICLNVPLFYLKIKDKGMPYDKEKH